MEFKAAILRDDTITSSIENVTLKELRDDEVVVRLVATGVCHSDITVRENKFPIPRPLVLGHEGSGVVERVGSKVTKVSPGDHVVLSFLSCGHCGNCEHDEPAYCMNFAAINTSGLRADGTSAVEQNGQPIGAHFFGQSSFATHSVANERNVVKVAKDAPLELLGPLGCGVQTGAGAVLNVLKPRPGQSMVVIGAGGVGLSGVMAAAVSGCNPIIVIEPNEKRRKVALEVGATHAIDPFATEDLVGDLQKLCNGGVDCALDAVGIPKMIDLVIAALAIRGQIVLEGIQVTEEKVQISAMEMSSKGIRIHGSTEGDAVPDTFIPHLVDLHMQGRFPIDKLVDYYAFEDLEKALDDQTAGLSIKPIVRISPI